MGYIDRGVLGENDDYQTVAAGGHFVFMSTGCYSMCTGMCLGEQAEVAWGC